MKQLLSGCTELTGPSPIGGGQWGITVWFGLVGLVITIDDLRALLSGDERIRNKLVAEIEETKRLARNAEPSYVDDDADGSADPALELVTGYDYPTLVEGPTGPVAGVRYFFGPIPCELSLDDIDAVKDNDITAMQRVHFKLEHAISAAESVPLSEEPSPRPNPVSIRPSRCR